MKNYSHIASLGVERETTDALVRVLEAQSGKRPEVFVLEDASSMEPHDPRLERHTLVVVALGEADDAFSALRRLRPGCPALVVSDRRSIKRALELEWSGPWDVLPAGKLSKFDVERALHNLSRLDDANARLARLRQEVRRREQQMFAGGDSGKQPGTGAGPTAQEAYSLRRLEQSIEMARRYGVPLVCLLASPRAASGDKIPEATMREISSRLEASVRATDLISQHGPDHFLVVSPFTDRSASKSLAARLQNQIAPLSADLELVVGVAEWNEDTARPRDLVERAADALARAAGVPAAISE